MPAIRGLAVGALLLVVLVACGDDDGTEEDSSDEDGSDEEGESSDLGEPVEIRTGIDAREVAVGAGGVWVVDDIEGSVFRIDPESEEVEAVDLGETSEPRGVAATDDAVWVTSDAPDPAEPFARDLVRIDPDSLEEDGRVPLPDEIAVDGIVATEEVVWVVSDGDGALLLEIDPDSLEIAGEVPLEGDFPQLAASDDSVWVIPAGLELLHGEPGSDELEAVELDDEIVALDALAADGEAAWVASLLVTATSEICRVESASGGAECADVGVGQGEAGGEETVDNMTFGDDALWVVVSGNAFEDTGYRVLRVDPDTLEVTDEMDLEGDSLSPFDIAVGEGAVWVTNDFGDEGGVFRIDT